MPLETALVVADGRDGNRVQVTEGSQRHSRVTTAL
jgi:hypothetical protein